MFPCPHIMWKRRSMILKITDYRLRWILKEDELVGYNLCVCRHRCSKCYHASVSCLIISVTGTANFACAPVMCCWLFLWDFFHTPCQKSCIYSGNNSTVLWSNYFRAVAILQSSLLQGSIYSHRLQRVYETVSPRCCGRWSSPLLDEMEQKVPS